MLKAAIASLLIGAGVVFAGLYLIYAVQAPAGAPARGWAWDLTSAQVQVGSGASSAQGWALTLDDTGRGALLVPLPALEARLYPLLHLQLFGESELRSLGIFWRTTQTGENMAQFWVPGALEESIWLPMAGMDVWDGQLIELAVLLQGKPGSELTFNSLRLLPGTPVNQLRALWADWNAFVPWGLASTNRHDATRAGHAIFYPVPIAAAWFGASLLAFGLLLLLGKHMRFDYRVIAYLFLICWICLDLVWQGKLLHQLTLTQEKFAGKNSMDKLASGPDGGLVQFMTYVQQRIGSSDARVLVGSRDDYFGMRANYYLYPMNVFWYRDEFELPGNQYIHQGDYIVLVNPSDVSFDRSNGVLIAPGAQPVKVQLLAESAVGNLYQVM